MISAPPDVNAWLHSPFSFEEAADSVWQWQLQKNPVIAALAENLNRREMFFVPVSFFRDFEMKSGGSWQAECIFRSSGTTGQLPSVHAVKDAQLYREASLAGFRREFGPGRFTVLALLPGYLEREDASLVFMVNEWIKNFGTPLSGFYLSDFAALSRQIEKASQQPEPLLLIGVAHALVDFAAEFPQQLPAHSIVMETGGMKGRKREMVRSELHDLLKKNLGVGRIASEYGMTEMLSQAYAPEGGKFRCPPWMRVVVTDLHHPFREVEAGESGRINLIDLMNVHSCSFLRTDDIGRMQGDGSFEVLGRVDHSELRGCSLMYV